MIHDPQPGSILLTSHCSWIHDVDCDYSDHLISTAGALSSLPSLKTLDVRILASDGLLMSPLPPLRDFKNLCTLSVSWVCSYDIPRIYCLQEIAAAINASPSLANLSIFNSGTHPVQREITCPPLQSFLQTSRPELVQLVLKGVPLPSAGIREILSHRLQQLSVATSYDGILTEVDWKGLWSALLETTIELSILTIPRAGNAMDEMFTYLLSYTGLRELRIYNDSQEEDRAGQRLWHEVIPHHGDTLAILSVTSRFEGEWCYGPRAAVTLWQCSSLRDLTISVCPVDSSWAEARLSRARKENKIELHGLKEPDGALENCGVVLPTVS
jgi:hypothetical protein